MKKPEKPPRPTQKSAARTARKLLAVLREVNSSPAFARLVQAEIAHSLAELHYAVETLGPEIPETFVTAVQEIDSGQLVEHP